MEVSESVVEEDVALEQRGVLHVSHKLNSDGINQTANAFTLKAFSMVNCTVHLQSSAAELTFFLISKQILQLSASV